MCGVASERSGTFIPELDSEFQLLDGRYGKVVRICVMDGQESFIIVRIANEGFVKVVLERVSDPWAS